MLGCCIYLLIDKNLFDLAVLIPEDFYPVNDPIVSQVVVGAKAEEILTNYQ